LVEKPTLSVETAPEPVFSPEPAPVPVQNEEKVAADTPSQPVASENATPETETAQNQINSLFSDDENKVYQGRLKIDIAPPVDSEQIATLERHLAENNDIRIAVKGGSADGSAWIELDAVKPLPLVDILSKIPIVKDVVGAKSYIIVALKAKQAG
jgi:hypothetical protein